MKRIITILLALVSAAAFGDVEIIVTASRIEEDSKTTPAYVRVIPEEEISKNSTVLDVLKTIPDISIKETSPGKSHISMGGFGENGFSRTLILINGRAVNRPDMAPFNWNSITLSSVERIEIVKGSLSSQYGDQAVAGVINIITKQPEGLTATVSASVAETFTNNQSVFASYGNETAGLAVGLNRTDNNPTRARSDSTILSANLDSYYNFFGIKAKLGGNYSASEYQLPGALTKAEYDADPDQATSQEDDATGTNYGINGDISFSLGDIDLSIPLSYSIVDTSSNWPDTTFPFFADTLLSTATAGVEINTFLYAGDSVEIIPIGGVDYKRYELNADTFSDVTRNTQTGETNLVRTDSAVWGRGKVSYRDIYIFEGGLRYSYSDLNTNPVIIHTNLVYDAGAVWLISPELRMSLRYGRVFRYPLLDEQYDYYFSTVNTDLIPETGDNYTASFEYASKDLRVTIAPYFIDMEDELVYNPVTFQNENTGPTIHYGASIESGYSKGIFIFTVGYSYDHGEFSSTDKTLPLIPEHNVYGSFKISPIQTLLISTNARYSSEFYTDNDNTDIVTGRFEWNMRVEWNATEDISWYISAKNILNDRTPTLAYWSSFSSSASWYPMPGRTFETGLKWVY